MERAWRYLEDITSVLREVGIDEGDRVLDCCCGSGLYAIASAALVGNAGRVYAIDHDEAELRRVRREAASRGLRNIDVIRQDVEEGIPLPDHAVDVVLLYDIFWYFRPSQKKIGRLLKEVRRVAKPRALISVYPTHVDQNDLERFKEEMKRGGFELQRECSSRLVHDKSLVAGTLLNYQRAEQPRGDP